MADRAHRETDEKLEEMERHLSAIYSRAKRKIDKEAREYAKSLKKQENERLKAYRKAQNEAEKREAKSKYISFLTSVSRSERFKTWRRAIADDMYNLNKQVSEYINKQVPEIYAMNYNAMGHSLDREIFFYDFTEVTEEEAEKYGQLTLQTIDRAKDEAWNEHNVSAAVLAGAIAMLPVGEAFHKMAATVTRKNLNSAKLHASDLTTDAENKGRLDSMKRADDERKYQTASRKYSAASLGFEIEKRWNATKDNRTRPTHRDRDGTTIPLDAEFAPGLSQPRDPNGSPEETHGCRCWLTYELPGIESVDTTMAARAGTVKGTVQEFDSFRGTRTVNVPDMTYKEWMEWKKHGNG